MQSLPHGNDINGRDISFRSGGRNLHTDLWHYGDSGKESLRMLDFHHRERDPSSGSVSLVREISEDGDMMRGGLRKYAKSMRIYAKKNAFF